MEKKGFKILWKSINMGPLALWGSLDPYIFWTLKTQHFLRPGGRELWSINSWSEFINKFKIYMTFQKRNHANYINSTNRTKTQNKNTININKQFYDEYVILLQNKTVKLFLWNMVICYLFTYNLKISWQDFHVFHAVVVVDFNIYYLVFQ